MGGLARFPELEWEADDGTTSVRGHIVNFILLGIARDLAVESLLPLLDNHGELIPDSRSNSSTNLVNQMRDSEKEPMNKPKSLYCPRCQVSS